MILSRSKVIFHSANDLHTFTPATGAFANTHTGGADTIDQTNRYVGIYDQANDKFVAVGKNSVLWWDMTIAKMDAVCLQ